MSCSFPAAHLRRARAIALTALATITLTTLVHAQAAPRDTARTDTSRVHRLERVMISAVRGGTAAPISQKTLTQGDIAPRYFGQDVPLVLQGAAPSLTAYAETANYWGYSYIRLRGIDQSRINLTIDGIPLNDPEDQVLYFADFPDLANSLRSIQVQRGVGTSSNGTAAYAGSINMEIGAARGDAARRRRTARGRLVPLAPRQRGIRDRAARRIGSPRTRASPRCAPTAIDITPASTAGRSSRRPATSAIATS